MYDEIIEFGLISYLLLCSIACFIIIFNNKLYPGFFKYKRYEKISWKWWVFTLILMLPFMYFSLIFLVFVIGSMILIAVATHSVYAQWDDMSGTASNKKYLSFREIAYFPYMFRVLVIYHYLFLVFSILILPRVSAGIYLLFYEDPFNFIFSNYSIFGFSFTLFLSLANMRRVDKLVFSDKNEMEK